MSDRPRIIEYAFPLEHALLDTGRRRGSNKFS